MGTSGIATYNQYGLELINDAYAIVGIDKPDQNQVSRGYRVLNDIIKSLQNEHVNIWALEWKTKTFSAASEVTGTDSKVYTCIKSHTSAASNRPVTGADWTTYWILRGTTGGAWVTSSAYSSLGDFALDADCLDIISAYFRDVETDGPELTLLSSAEYAAVSRKGDDGQPGGLWIDRSESPFRLYFNGQLDDTTNVFHYHQVRMLEDITYLDNNPDFKSRWLRALKYMAADDLSDGIKDLDIQVKSRISSKAEKYLRSAKSGDTERGGDRFIAPSHSPNRR